MSEFEAIPPEEIAQVTRKEEIRVEKAELKPETNLPDNITPHNEQGNDTYTPESEVVADHHYETINTRGHKIQINTDKLKEIKEKYGISDWHVQVDPKFSFNPSTAIWKTKTVVIRPFNFWSYMAVGSSVEKRNKVLPGLLAHELRHSQQEPPDFSLKGSLLSLRYGYWLHPAEIDAREWSAEHRTEFEGIIVITEKD